MMLEWINNLATRYAMDTLHSPTAISIQRHNFLRLVKDMSAFTDPANKVTVPKELEDLTVNTAAGPVRIYWHRDMDIEYLIMESKS